MHCRSSRWWVFIRVSRCVLRVFRSVGDPSGPELLKLTESGGWRQSYNTNLTCKQNPGCRFRGFEPAILGSNPGLSLDCGWVSIPVGGTRFGAPRCGDDWETIRGALGMPFLTQPRPKNEGILIAFNERMESGVLIYLRGRWCPRLKSRVHQ